MGIYVTLLPIVTSGEQGWVIARTKRPWFSYVEKIPDDRGFCCFLTIADFADMSGKSAIIAEMCDGKMAALPI